MVLQGGCIGGCKVVAMLLPWWLLLCCIGGCYVLLGGCYGVSRSCYGVSMVLQVVDRVAIVLQGDCYGVARWLLWCC